MVREGTGGTRSASGHPADDEEPLYRRSGIDWLLHCRGNTRDEGMALGQVKRMDGIWEDSDVKSGVFLRRVEWSSMANLKGEAPWLEIWAGKNGMC